MDNTAAFPTITGIVEKFTSKIVSGWVAAKPEDFPVRLDLWLNDIMISSTWADNVTAVDVSGAARSFLFNLKDVWSYGQTNDYISVCINSNPIPIKGVGHYRRIVSNGGKTTDQLRTALSNGYLFDRAGRLKLSKRIDIEWQSNAIELYNRVSQSVLKHTGYEVFLFYGTLLGQVREHDFIGHDEDFDTAYLSRATDGRTASNELRDLGIGLIRDGFDVVCKYTTLHIYDPGSRSQKVDLFHIYFDEHGCLALPFGRVSDSEFMESEWNGISDAQLGRFSVLVPTNAERIVQHLYGDNWIVPQAGFSWSHARSSQRKDGFTTESDRERIYWENFYFHNDLVNPSEFCTALNGRRDMPSVILDIGSGDGRDSVAWAGSGRQVIGVERSDIAIERANHKSMMSGLDRSVSFRPGDVTDTDTIISAVWDARALAQNDSILFYLRLILDSLTGDEQQILLDRIAALARPGDYFATEFRVGNDKSRAKPKDNHRIRRQDERVFSRTLRRIHDFSVLFDEYVIGMPDHDGNRSRLYRTVARKGHNWRTLFNRAQTFPYRIGRVLCRRLRGKFVHRISR